MMKIQFMKASSAIAFVSALLLSGCGGGGGDDGGSGAAPIQTPSTQAPSTVTSANAPDVAANAYASVGIINGEVTGGTMFITSAPTDPSGSAATKGVINVTLQHIHKVLAARSAGNVQLTATMTEQVACSTSGTMTFTLTEAASGVVSNGDSVTMTANNCVEGTVKTNGTLRVTFGAITGTPSVDSAWGATLGVTYTNFTVSEGTDSVTIHGDMTMTVSQTSSTNVSYSVSGTSFTVSMTSGGTTTSETLSAFAYSGSYISGVYTYGADFTMSGTFPNLGTASYVVKTTTPFKEWDGYYPHEGAMTVTATDKTSLRLVAISNTSVQIQIDKNADGTYEETVTTTWSALASRL